MYAALLTWNYSLTDHTKFLLQRSTNSGSTWATEYVLPSSSVSYLDTTVVPYGTYWYKIAATNDYGVGIWSNTGSIFVPPGIPSDPYNLVIVSGSAILTWSASSQPDYFAIQKATDGVHYTGLSVSLVETYTDTNVTASASGSQYWYQVAAVNISGTSSFSNTASITFTYDPPSGSIELNVDSGSALVSWTSSIANAQVWNLYRNFDGGGFGYIGSFASVTHSYRHEDVTGSYTGNTYGYKVHAQNYYGVSDDSNTSSITFQWPPLAPLNLVATSGSSYTNLTWDSGSDGSDVTSFERSLDGGATWISFGSIVSPPATDNTGISSSYEGITYYYRCYAYNAAGNSPNSVTASIVYQWPPLPPSLAPITSGSAILTWTTQSAVTDFIVLWRSTNGGVHYDYLDITNATASSYTDPNVTCSLGGQTYWYKVHAVVDAPLPLSSSLSNPQSITFTCGGPPPMLPSALNLQVRSGSAVLDWQKSGSEAFDYYSVRKSPNSQAGPYTEFTTSLTEHAVDPDVSVGNSYWYKVAAAVGAATGSFSNEAVLDVIPCNSASFQPIIYQGYVPYASASTYRNVYGITIPLSVPTSLSASMWVSSQDFDTYLTVADANGVVLAENNADGWKSSASGSSAIAMNFPSGTYSIEVSSYDNAIGRYTLIISPGAKLECTWSNAYETATCDYIPTSKYVVIGEQGTNIVFTNTLTGEVKLHNYAYTYGACYSPIQDKVYAHVDKNSPFTASIEIFDNTGSLIDWVDVSNTYIDRNGYLCYDGKNDRIFFAQYFYGNPHRIAVWDIATQTIVFSGSAHLVTSGRGIWQSCYSWIDNSYYAACTSFGSMVKVDAATFAVSATTQGSDIITSYISASNLMMTRASDDTVAFFDPLTDTIVHNQTDLPTTGLFECGGVGDQCSNAYIATIDPNSSEGGVTNHPCLALLDRNTYLPSNYMVINSDVPAASNPWGWYQYSIAVSTDTSKIYSAQVEYDNYEGRLYSLIPTSVFTSTKPPYQATSADTASCMTFKQQFQITGSDTVSGSTGYVCTSKDTGSATIAISNFEADGGTYHNFNTWFMTANGSQTLGQYTESYVHTLSGKNAVHVNGKYYMLTDGLDSQTPWNPVNATIMSVFDTSGSLLTHIPLTYSARDWDIGGDTIGNYIHVLEHDGATLWYEQIDAATDAIILTQQVVTDFSATPAVMSATMSMGSATFQKQYPYHGRMVVANDNGSLFFYLNNINFGEDTGSGDRLSYAPGGWGAVYGVNLSLQDGEFRGWTGGAGYCPLTSRMFWGAEHTASNCIVETDMSLNIIQVLDITSPISTIIYNPKNRTMEFYSDYTSGSNSGRIYVYDPVAKTSVCNFYTTTGSLGTSGTGGYNIDVNLNSGDVYVPQRIDGGTNPSTGSIKVYQV